MQLLLRRRANDSACRRSVGLFCYQVKKYIGALVAVLGGLDTLVFTAGIGEHAAPVRWEITKGLTFLKVELDQRRNAAGEPVVSTDASRVVVRVIAAEENLMVARRTWTTLFQSTIGAPH